MGKFIKETIIVLLICLVGMLGLAIGLYQFIPNRKVVPEVQKYYATEEVKDLKEENTNEVITSYSFDDSSEDDLKVTSSDLDGYESTNDYVPGKSNPFSEYTGSPTTENPNGEIKTTDDEKTEKDTEDKKETKKEPAVYSSSSGTK